MSDLRLGRAVVLVADQDRALSFYRDVLGLDVLHDEVAGDLRYLHVGRDGTGLWLMPAPADGGAPVGRQAGDHPLLVLYTSDLAALRRRLDERGVESWAHRTDADSASLHLRDADGNVLVVAQLLSG